MYTVDSEQIKQTNTRSTITKSITKSQMIRLYCSSLELRRIHDNVTSQERAAVLLAEADRRDGTLYKRLTAGLSDKTAGALLIAPAFIGGDSTDWDVFVTDVWQRSVTEANHEAVAQLFRRWYALVAPDEYHAPAPFPVMWGEDSAD
jgi:hypothetical protein